MKSDFMLAINQLCAERKLSREVVMEAVEAALISAYKRNFGVVADIEVQIESSTGAARVFAVKEIVEAVEDSKAQITLEDAREVDPDAELGGTVLIESTPRDFGRIAAQTAKQVILQRIREAELDVLYSNYVDRTGEIATGTIQSVDFNSGDVIISLEGGAEALLPSREQVPTERYRRGSRLRVYVLDVRRGNRGPQITVSRRSSALLRRLMELEVPEIFNGSVEIKGIAREAGSRSKVAVHATQEGVDPVGSCVGVRGGRIQNIVNELGGEKIDVVQWDSSIAVFIANSLSPAKVMNVLLEDNPELGKTGTVIVPDRQLSLAIGKEGQNARLAAKLTGWRIDIKSASEAAEETLGRFEEAEIPPEDMDLLSLAEALLRKRDLGGLTMEKAEPATAEAEDAVDLEWPELEPEAVQASGAGELDKVLESVGPSLYKDEEADQAWAKEDEDELDLEAEPGLAEVDEEAEAEDEPPFEGAPIVDSLGWVDTSGQEELYEGWNDLEQGEELWDAEALWEQEDLETPEKEAKESKKKKKRKGRQKFEFDDTPEDLFGRGRPAPRR